MSISMIQQNYGGLHLQTKTKNHILLLQDTYTLGVGPQHMTEIEIPQKYLDIH